MHPLSPPSPPLAAPRAWRLSRLHDRIGLLVSGATAIALLLSGLWWGVTTRDAIREEVSAATRVAEQWLLVLIREAEADEDTARLTEQLAAVGRIRANLLEVHDSEGRLRYRSPGSSYKAGREAPGWFATLLMPEFEARSYPASGMRVSLTPDASRSTLDAWDNLLQIAGWATALLVLLGLAVRAAIDRTLAPLAALEAALERSADGHFDTRLPRHGIDELDRLAERYNRMADELDLSLQRNAQLEEHQAFARAISSRLEDERRQIARDLHDEIGQSVTAVRAMAGAIAQRAGEQPTIHGSAQAILAMTSQMQEGVRTILQRLRRPDPLPRGRLAMTLQGYCDLWAGMYPDIELQRHIEPERSALDEDTCLAVLRVLQESLTNVARHACARRVEVSAGCADGVLTLQIDDDGRGFDAEAPSTRFGLLGMRERVAACHGRIEIARSVRGGTQVTAILPLPPATHADTTQLACEHDTDDTGAPR